MTCPQTVIDPLLEGIEGPATELAVDMMGRHGMDGAPSVRSIFWKDYCDRGLAVIEGGRTLVVMTP